MRFEGQGAHGAALVRDLFLFEQEDGRFLCSTERRIIGVLGGIIPLVGRQGGGKIQTRGHHFVLGREPPLRSQEGVAFFLAVIEDGFQIRFVGITVVLRADKGPVQVTGQLIDEGVGQIVGRVQQLTVGQVGAILFPQSQLQGKITATQIDEGIHARHHKFHGVDPLEMGVSSNIRAAVMEVSMGGRSNNCKESLTAEADPLCKASAVMVVGEGLQSPRGCSALLL